MKSTDFIKRMTDYQLEVVFIILGVYFDKTEYIDTQGNNFADLAKEGMKALEDINVVISNQFTIGEIKTLLKVEMMKRGIF